MGAQVDCLKRCKPLVLLTFSCSTSVAPEISTIWWCILKIIISREMYFCVHVISSLNPAPPLSHNLGSCLRMLSGKPGSLPLNLLYFLAQGWWLRVPTGDEYSRVGLSIVVYAVTFTCFLQSPRLWRINPRVLLALLVFMSTCFCQDLVRPSLNVTPRYLLLSVVGKT